MYSTVEEADAYFETRLPLPLAWINSQYKERALITASRFLNTLNWLGEKLSESQTDAFPRKGQAETPDELKYACCEIALMLLDGYDPEEEFDSLAVISQGIASARITYNRDTVPEHIVNGIPSSVAWRFIRPYLSDARDIRMDRVS